MTHIDPPIRPQRSRWRAALYPIALLAITFLAYLPGVRGEFIWDDNRNVADNRALFNLKGLGQIWRGTAAVPQYYPMTLTSYWLEFNLWGMNPLGYKIDDVLLHIANALLLYKLLRELNVPGAALAAVVFALHPIEVESVAWISERKNLLSTFFSLLSILAYLRVFLPLPVLRERAGVRVISNEQAHAKSQDNLTLALSRSTGRGNQIGWYLLSLLLFIAAVFSKTVACSTPGIILVLLWWKNGRVRLADVARLVPFFALGLPLARVTAQMEITYVGAHGPDWDLSTFERVLIAGRALWFYPAKLLWPTRITFNYPRWQFHSVDVLFPLAALALPTALWLLRRRLGRGSIAAVAIYAGVLAPALGFAHVYAMRYSFVTDHFQYAAGAALIALGCAALSRVIDSQKLIPIMGTALAILTWRQSHVYANQETLWNDVLAKNDKSWMARNNLAVILTGKSANESPDQARQDLERAVRLYAEVEQLRPQHEKVQANWADALFRLGRWEECLVHYTAAMNSPAVNKALALDRMGQALVQLHRNDEAEATFRTALVAGAGDVAHMHLGDLLASLNRGREALAEYAMVHSEPSVHLSMATILEKEGRLAEAAAHLETYLTLVPRDAAGHEKLGRLYLRLKRPSDAKSQFSAALELVPNFDAGREGLVEALREMQAGQ